MPYKGFKVSIIDSLGYLKSPVKIVMNKYIAYNFILNKVGKDSIQYCEVNDNNNNSKFVLRYFDMNNDFNELNEISVPLNLNFVNLYNQEVSPDQSKVLYNIVDYNTDSSNSAITRYFSISNKGQVGKLYESTSNDRLFIKDWYSSSDISFLKLDQQISKDAPPELPSIRYVTFKNGVTQVVTDALFFDDYLRIGIPYWAKAIPGTDDVVALWTEAALSIRPAGAIWEDFGGITKSIMRYHKSFLNTYLTKVEDDRILTITQSVSIYPNPTIDYLIHPQISTDALYIIIAIDGQQYQGKMTAGKIEVTHLPSGMYTLQAVNQGVLYVSKFIKN